MPRLKDQQQIKSSTKSFLKFQILHCQLPATAKESYPTETKAWPPCTKQSSSQIPMVDFISVKVQSRESGVNADHGEYGAG